MLSPRKDESIQCVQASSATAAIITLQMTANLRKLLKEAEKGGKYTGVPRFSVSFQKFSSAQACSLSTMCSRTHKTLQRLTGSSADRTRLASVPG